MKDKFKVGDEVREDCGCKCKILRVFKKSYRCISLEEILCAGEYNPIMDKITDVTDEGNIPYLIDKSLLDEIGELVKND